MSTLAFKPENYAPAWSLEAFFELEEKAEVRSEYFNGEIRAMAGANEEHEIASWECILGANHAAPSKAI